MTGMELNIFEDHSDELFQRDFLVFVSDEVSSVLKIVAFKRILEVQRPEKFVEVEI